MRRAYLLFALVLFGGLAHAQNPPGGYEAGGGGASVTGSAVVVVRSGSTATFTTAPNTSAPFTITDFIMLLTQNVTSSTIPRLRS